MLQGKSEQGMPSLSLLPENEELVTASCGSNLYPNRMAMSSKILPTKPSTSDKQDLDSSCLAFDISKVTRVFVLRNIQTVLQMILISLYASFYFKLPITVIDLCFKKGRVSWKCQALWYSIREIS